MIKTDKEVIKEKCKKCGKCCRVMFLDMSESVMNDRDLVRWINFHKGVKIVRPKGRLMLRIEAICSKLKNNKCSIYKNRPQLCKEYNCLEKGFPKP